MEAVVAIRSCSEYNLEEIEKHIAWLYEESSGPDPAGKKVLVKPNMLSDDEPVRAMTTHPVVIEAVIRYLQSRGATVFAGDSPTIDNARFTGEKSGIRQAIERCNATWVRFNESSVTRKAGPTEIKLTALITKADLLISVSKLKNHELMILSGAMKNIFGFVPGFNKAMQHVSYPNRYKFARFFVDLEEAVRPDFHIMDGIVAMEGPGPGNGYPRKVNALLASSNPLALDIVASRILGYDPLDIPINRIALERGSLLSKMEDIKTRGPDPETIAVRDFKRIYKGGEAGILLKHLKKKIPLIRRSDRRPLFNRELCTGCSKCIEICPLKILYYDERKRCTVLINDAKCIRCFCCAEVCREGAIDIRRKIF